MDHIKIYRLRGNEKRRSMWECVSRSEGQDYFYHTHSRETRWVKPIESNDRVISAMREITQCLRIRTLCRAATCESIRRFFTTWLLVANTLSAPRRAIRVEPVVPRLVCALDALFIAHRRRKCLAAHNAELLEDLAISKLHVRQLVYELAHARILHADAEFEHLQSRARNDV